MCQFLTDPKANEGNNWFREFFFKYYFRCVLDRCSCNRVFSPCFKAFLSNIPNYREAPFSKLLLFVFFWSLEATTCPALRRVRTLQRSSAGRANGQSRQRHRSVLHTKERRQRGIKQFTVCGRAKTRKSLCCFIFI